VSHGAKNDDSKKGWSSSCHIFYVQTHFSYGKQQHLDRRKIRLVESNAKCRYLKKLTCKGTLQQVFICVKLLQVFICLRPPPLQGFCLGWSSNFVGSESGQKQSVKLLQNMASNTTQYPPPPPSHTLSVYTVRSLWEGGVWWGR